MRTASVDVLGAHREVGRREIFSKEVAPKAHYDFQKVRGRDSPLIVSLFAQIDHKISFPIWPDAKSSLAVATYKNSRKACVSREMLRAVRQLLNHLEPDAVSVDPVQELFPVSFRFAHSIARSLVLTEPIPPNPLMKMIGGDSIVHCPSCRMWLDSEVVKIINEHGIEISRAEDIEHLQKPSSKFDFGRARDPVSDEKVTGRRTLSAKCGIPVTLLEFPAAPAKAARVPRRIFHSKLHRQSGTWLSSRCSVREWIC